MRLSTTYVADFFRGAEAFFGGETDLLGCSLAIVADLVGFLSAGFLAACLEVEAFLLGAALAGAAAFLGSGFAGFT